MTVIVLQLQAIWTGLCRDPSLQYGIKNDDHGAIIICTDSLLCTTSPREWDVYCRSVW